MNKIATTLLIIAFSYSCQSNAGTIDLSFDAGAPHNSSLVGHASVTNDMLRLTPSKNGQNGQLRLADADNGLDVVKWDIGFDFRFSNVGGLGAADGIGISFGRLGQFDAAMNGVTQEEGLNSGIAIGIDTWRNGGEVSGNHISVRYDGVLLQEINLSNELADGQFHRLIASMDNGHLALSLDNNQLLSHNIINWQAYAGQFVFGGRTGGGRTLQEVDNVSVRTAAVPEPASIALLGLGLFVLLLRRKN